MKTRLVLLQLSLLVMFGLAVNSALVASEEDIWGENYGKYHPENYPEEQQLQQQNEQANQDNKKKSNRHERRRNRHKSGETQPGNAGHNQNMQ